MKMLRVDLIEYRIVDEIEVFSQEKVRGSHLETEKGLIPAAFLFPLEAKGKVQVLLDRLNKAKSNFEVIRAQIFYVEIPMLRS